MMGMLEADDIEECAMTTDEGLCFGFIVLVFHMLIAFAGSFTPNDILLLSQTSTSTNGYL